MEMDYTLNIKGQLLSLSSPRVMGILNATPDSFYCESRAQEEDTVCRRVERMLAEGASMIDIGACSTRPGSTPATEQEEMARLRAVLSVVRHHWPKSVLSIDTFRPDVARMAVEEYGADIINDVAEGQTDMLRMVSRLGVPYILMSARKTLDETLLFFADRVQKLRDMGQKDIILDPGFGFGKPQVETAGAYNDYNYALMAQLDKLQVMQLPVLVGISRKSMIYRLLDCQPDGALNGTTILNTVALMKGASILRVHDVREAVECVKITSNLLSYPHSHVL